MKRPKKIDEYLPAHEATIALRQLADDIDRGVRSGDVVKWNVTIYRWNDAWLDSTTRPAVIVQYHSGKE